MATFTNTTKNSTTYKNQFKTGIARTIGDIKNYTIAELKTYPISSFKAISYTNKSLHNATFTNLTKN